MNKRLKKKTYQYRLLLFYSKIGEIANICSMIEYNLIQIISERTLLDKIGNKNSMLLLDFNQYVKAANDKYKNLNEYNCLKQLINDAYGQYGLSTSLKNELHKIREKRNYYIHGLFQDDLKGSKWIFSNPEKYFKEINSFKEHLYLVNNKLISIDTNNRGLIKSFY